MVIEGAKRDVGLGGDTLAREAIEALGDEQHPASLDHALPGRANRVGGGYGATVRVPAEYLGLILLNSESDFVRST